MPLFGSSNSCTKHHGAPASLAEAARGLGGAPSCLAVTSTRQAAKRAPTTVGKNMDLVFIFTFVELGPDILECDASWYVPVIARAQVFKKLLGGWSAAMLRATLRQLAKFPMRWSSGADRDQPWLARSLPVDCRATDGTLRCGGHYEVLPVERPRKHAAMRWALQMFSRRGAALPLLDV